MTISQDNRLMCADLIGEAMYTLPISYGALAFAFGVAVGPVAWIAMSVGVVSGVALSLAAKTKRDNPNMDLIDYNPNNHYRVTNGFYNLFSSVAKTAGFYTPPAAPPAPAVASAA